MTKVIVNIQLDKVGSKPLLLEDNLTSNRNKIQSKIKISEYYFLDKNGLYNK